MQSCNLFRLCAAGNSKMNPRPREEATVSSVFHRMQLAGIWFVLCAVAAEAAPRLVVFEGFYRVT